MIITRWIWVALGILSCAMVVLLHRQRSLRRSRRVSSLFLWQLVADKLHAARRRRRLVTTVILLAQLLTLLTLSLSLAGPHQIGQQPLLSLGIIVDTSQSMALNDLGVSRLEAATRAIEQFVRDGEATRYTLWTTTAPHLKIDTDSKDELIASLHALPQPQGVSDWDGVLSMLPSRLDQDLSFHLLIAGDGAADSFASDELSALSRAGNVHLIQVGTPVENVGITQMQVRPVGSDLWSHQALVEVSNFSNMATDTHLRITEQIPLMDTGGLSEPGVILDQRLHVAAHQSEVVIFEWTVTDGAILQAALADRDAFPYDDMVQVVATFPHPTQVLVVGEDNHFLSSILDVIDSLEVAYSDRSALATERPFDLVIFNEAPVPSDFRGTAVHFAPSSSQAQVSTNGVINQVVWWLREHPLFRFVDWQTVDILASAPLVSDPAHQVFIQGTQGPLMILDETPMRRILRVGFSIDQTDLPYRIAFPIFLGNVLDWAHPLRHELIAPPLGLLSSDESNLSVRWAETLEPMGARLIDPLMTLHTLTKTAGRVRSQQAEPSVLQRPLFQPRLWQWTALVAALLIVLEGLLYLGPRRSVAQR